MKGQIRNHSAVDAVLAECRRRYVRLRIRDNSIAVIGHRLMTPALWTAIREHEPALIVALEQRRAAQMARVFEFRLTSGPRRFLI
ncbi:MAG: hypothetical protein ACYDBH_20155, partial [Acidobacteriaceae bacterium]